MSRWLQRCGRVYRRVARTCPSRFRVICADGLEHRFVGVSTGGVLLGIGTAMVYPTLLAAIGDVAAPAWRASSVGVCRLWRDLATRWAHYWRVPPPTSWASPARCG